MENVVSDDAMIVNVFLNGPRRAYCHFGHINGERYMEMGYEYDYVEQVRLNDVIVATWRLTDASAEKFGRERP